MPDYTGSQTPAAIGQRRDGVVVIAEEGVAAKDPVLFAEVPVHSEIRLILIVRFIGRANEVVGAGYVGERIVLEDLECD